MFAIDELIGECRGALSESRPSGAVRDILARALSKPDEVAAAFEPPERAELTSLYASPELTIVKVIWAPGMELPPHDHRMWAVIGIYGGAEDNRFFRRSPDGLVASGQKELSQKETVVLGDNTIHSVTNPSGRTFTGAIHIYGGDFFNQPRSLWNPETMEEQPATGERMRTFFDAANERLAETSP
jgi:predicted metal-dependent enzyme (double-stranded beta helix superfamily)